MTIMEAASLGCVSISLTTSPAFVISSCASDSGTPVTVGHRRLIRAAADGDGHIFALADARAGRNALVGTMFSFTSGYSS